MKHLLFTQREWKVENGKVPEVIERQYVLALEDDQSEEDAERLIRKRYPNMGYHFKYISVVPLSHFRMPDPVKRYRVEGHYYDPVAGGRVEMKKFTLDVMAESIGQAAEKVCIDNARQDREIYVSAVNLVP